MDLRDDCVIFSSFFRSAFVRLPVRGNCRNKALFVGWGSRVGAVSKTCIFREDGSVTEMTTGMVCSKCFMNMVISLKGVSVQ